MAEEIQRRKDNWDWRRMKAHRDLCKLYANVSNVTCHLDIALVSSIVNESFIPPPASALLQETDHSEPESPSGPRTVQLREEVGRLQHHPRPKRGGGSGRQGGSAHGD